MEKDFRNHLLKTRKKGLIRKKFEEVGLSKEELEKAYKELNLPEDPTIDKSDFLEYYLFFGNNIELYKFINPVIKSKNMKWKDAWKLSTKDVNDYLAR